MSGGARGQDVGVVGATVKGAGGYYFGGSLMSQARAHVCKTYVPAMVVGAFEQNWRRGVKEEVAGYAKT